MNRFTLALIGALTATGCFIEPAPTEPSHWQNPGTPVACGDGVCASGEDCQTCPADCGQCPVCWDVDLGSGPVDGLWTTTGRADSRRDATCGDGGSGPDLALRWTAPARGRYLISVTEADFRAILEVRTGSCPGWELTCADTASSAGTATAALDAGEQIVIVIDGAGSSYGQVRLAVTALPSRCGDGWCDGSEDCDNCASDCGRCGPVCGNGWCEAGEDCSTCSRDCGACGPTCGDGSPAATSSTGSKTGWLLDGPLW